MAVRDRWDSVLASARTWSPPARRTVVVAPHPDDETLSAGGLVVHQRNVGVEVVIVAVTDGEASYDPAGDASLAATRRGEQRSALDVLGVADGSIRRLGFPDSHVDEDESDLSDRIIDVLRPGDLLVATWNHDVHPDHEACGRAALEAAAQVPVTLIFSLFWTWHHRRPDEIDAGRLLSFELDADDRRTKQRAMREHASQFDGQGDRAPVLDEQWVEPAMWTHEYFVESCGPAVAEVRP
ncbi:PIG-L deacetylase family protein [Ilumatobacter sp.]|uniref:PIG-L deacetylase family protein n=1 Tax=Ilumatobacter sp. TaxID=1967498 RepID=UPI003C6F8DEC